MNKKSKIIGCIVLFFLIAYCYFVKTGLPPHFEALVGDVGARIFGFRHVANYDNGQVQSIIILKGKRIPLYGIYKLPINDGKYYDFDGNLVSRIKNGYGVAVVYHNDGRLKTMCLITNGVADVYHCFDYSEDKPQPDAEGE